MFTRKMERPEDQSLSSPLPVAETKIRVHWGVVLAAAAIALTVQMGAIVSKFQSQPTGLFRISEQFYRRGPEELFAFQPHLVIDGEGYDGQFFYFLAHDPFLLNGVEQFLDAPSLRARRIGYPLIAWAVSLGQKPAIPAALFLVNFMACVGATALLARRMIELKSPQVFALGFVLSAAVLMAIYVMSCEVVALFFLFLAFWAYEYKKAKTLLASSLLAILVKEVCILWLAGLALHALLTRQWRTMSIVLLAGVGWLGWGAYVQAQLAEPTGSFEHASSSGAMRPYAAPSVNVHAGFSLADAPLAKVDALMTRLGYFSLPYAGAAKRLAMSWNAPEKSLGRTLTETGLMLTLVLMATRAIVRLRWRDRHDPLAITFALVGLCAVSLNADVWAWSGNFTRQLYMLPALALWVGPRSIPSRVDIGSHVFFSVAKILFRG